MIYWRDRPQSQIHVRIEHCGHAAFRHRGHRGPGGPDSVSAGRPTSLASNNTADTATQPKDTTSTQTMPSKKQRAKAAAIMKMPGEYVEKNQIMIHWNREWV